MNRFELGNMTGAELLDLAKRIQLGCNPLVEMIKEVNTLDAETGKGDLHIGNIETLERNINLGTTYSVQFLETYNNEDYSPGVYETTYIFTDICRDDLVKEGKIMNERDSKDMTLLIEKMNKVRLLHKKGMLTEEEYEAWVYYYYTLLTVTMESDGTLRYCPSCNVPIKDSRAEHCWNCGYHIMIDNEFDEQ